MAVIYLCPTDKRLLCSWEGFSSEIKQHFENEHKELLFYTNSIEADLSNLPENKLMVLENQIYLIQNFFLDKKLIIKLRYLGSYNTASKLQYDVTIFINEISFRYEPSQSYLIPTSEGWQVDLEMLEKNHKKIETIKYSIFVKNLVSDRKISGASLKIGNKFIEKNVCDEAERVILSDISLCDSRIEELRKQSEVNNEEEPRIYYQDEDDCLVELRRKKRESGGDCMDKISQLNFDMLELPFSNRLDEHKIDFFKDSLPNIPEEFNLPCSFCNQSLIPPIFLCVNGHNVCSWCKSYPCKICSGNITINRNTTLENISRTHLHHCRFSHDGCNERLMYNELKAHEAKCRFCKYKCVICPYEDRFDHFCNHLKIVHPSIKCITSTRCNFPKNTELYMVHNSVGIFYCKSEVVDDFVIWRAIFCGPPQRTFFCDLSFKGSKYKETIFLRRNGNVYEIRKSLEELKKNKAKEKYAVLNIASYG